MLYYVYIYIMYIYIIYIYICIVYIYIYTYHIIFFVVVLSSCYFFYCVLPQVFSCQFLGVFLEVNHPIHRG